MKLIILLLGIIIITALYIYTKGLVRKHKNKHQRSVLKKVVRIGYLLILTLFIVIVLGFEIQNLWLTLGSVLALIAIGFIAVWSMFSNIVAALILFISGPFKINSYIKILPSNIEGRVDEITLFYTILEDKKGNLVHIPNNMFFQKEFIHVVTKK